MLSVEYGTVIYGTVIYCIQYPDQYSTFVKSRVVVVIPISYVADQFRSWIRIPDLPVKRMGGSLLLN
jgi:hypothetical protein